MSFFSKIFNPFVLDDRGKINRSESHESEATNENNVSTPRERLEKETIKEEQRSTSISDIGILAESVKELIIDSVAPFTGNDDFVGLSIWVNDQSYHIVKKEAFIQDLRASFDSMHLFSLGKGEIKVIPGEPAGNDEASPLVKNGFIPSGKIWIRLIEEGKAEVKHSKARLCVLQGFGSCMENEYILSSDDKQVYRIGRGVICRKPGLAYRVNDIVIEENNADVSIQKLNNFVSSAQADIILDNGYFYLKALPSGCRTSGGSPTKIIRNQEPIELRDSVSSHKLADGDIIELGKSVLLLFKVID